MSGREDEIRECERASMSAAQRKDLAELDRILAAEFAYLASGTGRQTR